MYRDLVKNANFQRREKQVFAKLTKIAKRKGVFFGSTQKLYKKILKEGNSGFTVPAINLRTLTFDMARRLFRAGKENPELPFIIEIAPSEINYTEQSPLQYSISILSAALVENYKGNIYLQGDHFKIKRGSNLKKQIRKIKKLIKKSVAAGFYNFDIDASALSLEENANATASLTDFIRKIEPKRNPFSVGGEVGEIGGENTTKEETEEFLEEYKSKIVSEEGIIKLAIQTGTSHGGTMLPNGEMKVVEEDFNLIKGITKMAKNYGVAGVVQHGASTLPKSHFHKFPESKTLEIHLATDFQNIFFEHSVLPADLRERMYDYIKEKYKKEKDKYKTEEQFIYKNRKRALGRFKEEIWNLPQENIDIICNDIEKKFRLLFRQLSK